ncbi:DUF2235 domain-containing protein [Parerythrobacter jejuensis]|uniref:DUF2235 domain-containing protein n=1 Tax=Parerythrobacter jejuensis TaxID=795812 RepID=A0A845AN44_9SPHN|nr:DUF2235 domain-containing protein [Parerythrobacter jejuensis]MXP30583.1 DUF2235 domain-containing protein [Parerythrobacter jejuensis]MXP33343.1 DUF2235 domain-containing protein [Parerythrobacter jejuensis]
MKRIIICCDGTWQSLDNDWPTNVQRIAQFIKPTGSNDITQTLYYNGGVGLGDLGNRIAGGVFGAGLDDEIEKAFIFLSLNYEPEDEIYLFGFSRGAYTVRSLAGLIRSCGIFKRNNIGDIPKAMVLYRNRLIGPDHDECINVRIDNSPTRTVHPPNIHFIGCFDTVGSLGIPIQVPLFPFDDFSRNKHQFHDTQLSSIIKNARHAVAIDEQRKDFDVTKMLPQRSGPSDSTFEERWFPGTHTCVGGGIRSSRGLADGPLRWMIEEAKACGLEFNQSEVDAFTHEDSTIEFEPSERSLLGQYRPLTPREGPTEAEAFSPQAIQRWESRLDYRPEQMAEFFD